MGVRAFPLNTGFAMKYSPRSVWAVSYTSSSYCSVFPLCKTTYMLDAGKMWFSVGSGFVSQSSSYFPLQ